MSNERLSWANQELSTKIERLQTENKRLMEMMVNIRQFITEKCAKIPFFGKKLIQAMDEEIGNKELPNDRDI